MNIPSKKVLLGQITKINIASTVIAILFAVLAVVLMSGKSIDLVLNYMARDSLASSSNVVLAPAHKVLFTPDLKYIVAGSFVIFAIMSLLLATKLKNRYDNTLKANISGFRWLLVGISSGLMLEVTSILAGVNDVMSLKLVGGLIVITCVLGWISDRENSKPRNSHWLAYIASIFTGILAWVPLLGALFGTWYWGLERFGWWVYALGFTLLVSFILYATMQKLHLSGKKSWKEYNFIERNFLGIDLITKIVFGVILLIAFYK